MVDEVALGQVFSQHFWRWYNRPLVAAVPSRLNLTPLIIIIIIIRIMR
jgi:hypothetical protein